MKSALLVSLVAPLAVYAEELKFKKTSISAPFIEQFTSDWDTRWKVSEAQKQMPEDYKAPEGESAEDLFRYRGQWAVEKAAKEGLEGDKGLVAKTPAAHHAISVAFPKSVDPEGKDFVVQYDLKLQEDLQCGGAYIKLLTDSKSGIKYQEFDDKTPYTIMFGPDRCGSTNKVHFIFRHLNPKTNKYEEKHLKTPPAIKTDQKTNLYTLVVHPDNTFEMYINLEKVKSGNLLEDFDPPVNPPKEIDDPEDKKPEDWVDEAKIPDPDAKKPDDWDEEAPRMIPDEDAVKPDDWLEDEPETIPDPNAEKPEDWDDEEDGEWVAPQVPNPKCESASGCGKWTRPMKPNPDYKGKWYAPLIDNPAYKGPWAPKKIANPNFYEDLHPAKFNKIMGLGIELWTMQSGIMFDNFYVGHSFEDAKKLAEETYSLKGKIENAAEEKEKKKAEEAEAKTGETAPKSVDELSKLLFEFFAAAAADPVEGFKKYPVTGAAVLFTFASPILLYLVLFRSSGKKIDEVGKRKKEDISTADDDEADDVKPKKKPVKKDE